MSVRITRISIGLWTYHGTQDQDTGEIRLTPVSRRGAVERVAEAARAVASVVTHPAMDPEALAAREAACRGCAANVRNEHGEFCRECGCPDWKVADLAVKRRLPLAKCPLGSWPT